MANQADLTIIHSFVKGSVYFAIRGKGIA